MKDGTYGVELAIAAKSIPAIEWAKCDCPAGKGPHGSCKHLAALMYALEDFSRTIASLDANTSVTSKLQQWNIPRKRKLFIRVAEELDFRKPKHPTRNGSESPGGETADKKFENRTPISFHRDPRLLSERGTVVTRLAPSLKKLPKGSACFGLTLLVNDVCEQYVKAKEARLIRAKQCQAPWLELRDKKRSEDITTDKVPGTGENTMEWLQGQAKLMEPFIQLDMPEELSSDDPSSTPHSVESSSPPRLEHSETFGHEDEFPVSENEILHKSVWLLHKQVLAAHGGTVDEQEYEDIDRTPVPGCVRWGGKVGDLHLTNTCPIDNFFTIIWACDKNDPSYYDVLTDEMNQRIDAMHHLTSAIDLLTDYHCNPDKSASAKVLWQILLACSPKPMCTTSSALSTNVS